MDFEPKTLAIVAVAIVALIAAYFIFLTPVYEATGQGEWEKGYSIKYSTLKVSKQVSVGENRHTEKISLRTDSESLDFAIFTVIPKSLAEDLNHVEFVTNGRIDKLGSNLIEVTPKNSPDSVTLQMEFSPNNVDICTVNAIFPISFLGGLAEGERQELNTALLSLDLDLNCDTANEMENTLAEELIAAFTTA